MNNKKILETALKRFDLSVAQESYNRKNALKSIKFADGDQWPDSVKKERENNNRPCLTINKIRKFINQISGDLIQNRPALKVRPVDSQSDIKTAQTFNHIIDHIERNSNAEVAYENGFKQALDGGYGYWRIIPEYIEGSFDQDIKISKINNRFSVYLDQNAQEDTFEDGEYAFITDKITNDKFIEIYGKNGVKNWNTSFDDVWYFEDYVRIAEYFYKEYETVELAQMPDGKIINTKIITDEEKQYFLENDIEIPTRKEKVTKIKWCLLSKDKILEGPKTVPGKYIPIVPILGYEVNYEGRRIFRSVHWDSMDPQIMYNYWKTHETEVIALTPKIPFIITPQQKEGHDEWNDAHIKNYSYLEYNHIPGVAKPQREPPIVSPTGVVNAAQMASLDIQDTVGKYAASMGQPSNERSGRAILARQRSADNTTYTFVNNFEKSIVFTGKILIEMIPEVITNEQTLHIINNDGKSEIIELNKPYMNFKTGKWLISNDLSRGRYDVVVTTGPTFQTKRMEIAASMLDFLQFVPMAAPVIAPKLAKVMDWDGAESIADELKNLLSQQEQVKNNSQQNLTQGETNEQ